MGKNLTEFHRQFDASKLGSWLALLLAIVLSVVISATCAVSIDVPTAFASQSSAQSSSDDKDAEKAAAEKAAAEKAAAEKAAAEKAAAEKAATEKAAAEKAAAEKAAAEKAAVEKAAAEKAAAEREAVEKAAAEKAAADNAAEESNTKDESGNSNGSSNGAQTTSGTTQNGTANTDGNASENGSTNNTETASGNASVNNSNKPKDDGKKSATYTVRHWLVNADGSITLLTTESLKAESGKTVTANVQTPDGFTLDSAFSDGNGHVSKMSGTVAENGSLVLDVFYVANGSPTGMVGDVQTGGTQNQNGTGNDKEGTNGNGDDSKGSNENDNLSADGNSSADDATGLASAAEQADGNGNAKADKSEEKLTGYAAALAAAKAAGKTLHTATVHYETITITTNASSSVSASNATGAAVADGATLNDDGTITIDSVGTSNVASLTLGPQSVVSTQANYSSAQYFSDNNTYWQFQSHKLTISASNGTGKIDESGGNLPWKVVPQGDIFYVEITADIVVKNMTDWFPGWTSLISITGLSHLKTQNVTNYVRTFQGCTALRELDLSGWDTTSTNAKNFTGMLSGCTSLRTLNLTGWNVASSDTRDDMFKNLTSIGTLTIPGTVDLSGTGFSAAEIDSRVDTAGTWVASDGTFSGHTSDLVTHIPETASTPHSYVFNYTSYFDSNENRNVEWSYDTGTSTLTIYIVDNPTGTDFSVSEAAAALPWRASVDITVINTVRFVANALGNKVAPTSLASWFAGYQDLGTFDGAGANVANTTSFANLFNGDTNLSVVDISTWNMAQATTNASVDGMFYNCTSLGTLTINDTVALANAGFINLTTRQSTQGSWNESGGPWFGTTTDLVRRYPVGANPTAFGPITYTWTPNQLWGRFANNDRAWWKYTKSGSTGTLEIGIDATYTLGNPNDYTQVGSADTTNGDEFKVTAAANALPWMTAQSGVISNTGVINAITTSGNIAPTTLAGWFQNYQYITSFNGSGMNVTYTTSFANLFNGASRLETVNLTGWNMVAGKNSVDSMFDGCLALVTLTVSSTAVLQGSGISNSLSEHTPSDGSWVTSGNAWFGNGDNLAARYPTNGGSLSTDFTYTWNGSMLSGRFSNDNIYWVFDENDVSGGLLTIGVSDNTKSKTINETALTLPWRTTPGVSILSGDRSIRSVKFVGGVTPLGDCMVGWFGGGELVGKENSSDYPNLTSFDGTGLNTSQATSFAQLFANCKNLAGLTGLGSWNVGNVESFAYMFYNCAALSGLPDMSSWNTAKVKNFSFMFYYNYNITSITTFKSWDVKAATTFESMFDASQYLATLDISEWEMPVGATRKNMFRDLQALTTFTIGPRVILAADANGDSSGFDGNFTLETPYISTRVDNQGSWDRTDTYTTTGNENYNAALVWFGTTSNLAARYGTSYNNLGVATYVWASGRKRGRFANDNAWWTYDSASYLLTLGTTVHTAGNGISVEVSETYQTQPWLAILTSNTAHSDIASIIVESGSNLTPTNIYMWFSGYHGLRSFDGSGLHLKSGETDLSYLFYDDEKLASLSGLANWKNDVSTVKTFAHMFDGAKELTQFNGVSQWNTASLENVSYMFYGANKLVYMTEVGSWDMADVTDYSYFLSGATVLQELNMYNWDMKSDANRTDMLKNCVGLLHLTVGPGVILDA